MPQVRRTDRSVLSGWADKAKLGDVPLIVKTVDGLAEKKYRNCFV